MRTHVGEVQARRLSDRKSLPMGTTYGRVGVLVVFRSGAFLRCQIAAILRVTLLPSGVWNFEITDRFTRLK